MSEPEESLDSIFRDSLALYNDLIEENLAADRAVIGGGFFKHLKVQAKTARDALGVPEDDNGTDDVAGESGQ